MSTLASQPRLECQNKKYYIPCAARSLLDNCTYSPFFCLLASSVNMAAAAALSLSPAKRESACSSPVQPTLRNVARPPG